MRGGRGEIMNKKHIIMAACLAVAGCATSAWGGSEDLGVIDVTSSRVEAPSITSSKPVTVIDRKTIENSHAENVVDVLKGQANIVVRDTSGVGARSQVDLGGYGETGSSNNVVLVDGRRVNSADLSGTDWTQIPVDQIERIEVVHGGGSVLYGDGAVGGVINIITRIPESGGSISFGGGSFGEYSGRTRIGADSEKTRMEINVSALSTKGYRNNSFFDRFDAGARAEADLAPGVNVHLSGNHHQDRAGLPGQLSLAQVAANPRQTTTPNDFSKTTDSFVDAGFTWAASDHLDINLDGGYRHRNTHADFVSFGSATDSIVRTRSLRPKLVYSDGNLKLIAGADVDDSNGDMRSFSSTVISRKRQGYYGLVEWGDSQQRWNISAGARSEHVKTTFQPTGDTLSDRIGTWELGTSIGLTDQLRFRANASSSLRFPLLDEYFSLFFGTVDTTLLPQKGRHYSSSARYDWDKAWLEVSLSRADINHEIFFNPLTFSNDNYLNKTRHDVVMVSGAWNADDLLQLTANYTYTKATFRGGAFSGKSIPAVPVDRAGMGWQADWNRSFSTNVNLSYVGSSFQISDQSNAGAKLASYALLDVVGRYHWQNIEMFARIDNLTNKKYSNYAAYDFFYPAAGIAVRGGVSYRF